MCIQCLNYSGILIKLVCEIVTPDLNDALCFLMGLEIYSSQCHLVCVSEELGVT